MKRSSAPPPSSAPVPTPSSKHATPHYFTRHPARPIYAAESPGTDACGADVSGANTAGMHEAPPGQVRYIEARARHAGGEVALRMATGVGVFARSGLDAGSVLLIETARWTSQARVLDLGCGWGGVGCFAAAFAPDCRVWMCDINGRAVALAQLNLRENGLTNVAAWCGDGGTAVRSEFFDAVLCNPPVRAGNAVMARLFEDARRVLKSGGALWVVLRTAQGAKSWQRRLQAQFGNCETVAIERGYRILKCVK